MSLPLTHHPLVQADVREAYLWYEEQREGPFGKVQGN
jgi:hypothetical protein